jgi:secretion/DNA translocation related TadE-like protein
MRKRGDRGAVTVLALAVLAMLILLTAGFGVAEAIVVAHRRAQAAADLAALAAAQAIQRARDPCGEASTVAAGNGAALDQCRIDGEDVLVTARVPGPRWLGAHGDLSAQARAGPGTVDGHSPEAR